MTIEDNVLTTNATNPADRLRIELEGKTINDVIALISAHGSYTAGLVAAAFYGDAPATALVDIQDLDVESAVTQNKIELPDSYLWWMGLTADDSWSTAEDDYEEGMRQSTLRTAEDQWVDYWAADWFGYNRIAGESDEDYKERVLDALVELRLTPSGIAATFKNVFNLPDSGIIIRDSHGTFILNDFPNSKTMTTGDNGVVARHILGGASLPTGFTLELYLATGEVAPSSADAIALLNRLTAGGTIAAYTVINSAGADLPGNLISWWPMNALTGDRYDAYMRNHLYERNATIFSLPGRVGLATDFEAADDAGLDRGHPAVIGIDESDDITIACWVNLESVGTGDQILLGKLPAAGTLTSATFVLGIDSSGDPFVGYGDGTTFRRLTGGSTLSTGSWYYLVGVIDQTSTQMRLRTYDTTSNIDSSSVAMTNAPVANVESMRCGGVFTAVGNRIDGLVDNLTLFDTAHNNANADALYNANGVPL
jgi:hypothetical protein